MIGALLLGGLVLGGAMSGCSGQKAASAPLCANEPDKLWELHDLMLQAQEQPAGNELKA